MRNIKIYHRENGSIEIMKDYDDVTKISCIKDYYYTGLLCGSSYYKNNILHGYQKTYYFTGGLQTVNYYFNGFQQDLSLSYHENGKIKHSINYGNGKENEGLSKHANGYIWKTINTSDAPNY